MIKEIKLQRFKHGRVNVPQGREKTEDNQAYPSRCQEILAILLASDQTLDSCLMGGWTEPLNITFVAQILQPGCPTCYCTWYQSYP
jgi:hypothetical protein